MMAFSRLSRFGMTFKPLTADRGEALLMSYLEAFPVKTSQQQEKEPESKEIDLECGEKWLGWSAKFDPHTSTLRTAQCSLLEEEPELLQTLPRSGMTRSGMLWERQTLVLRTSETESGSWPTPMSSEYKANKNYRPGRQNGLTQAVMKWPTPVKSDSQARRPSKGWKEDSDLPSVVWTESGGKENPNLPPAQLNPTWVEWLMGWPLGWTDLKPLEMDKFQQWQQQHLDC
jgi:hypothetical protein